MGAETALRDRLIRYTDIAWAFSAAVTGFMSALELLTGYGVVLGYDRIEIFAEAVLCCWPLMRVRLRLPDQDGARREGSQ